MRAETEALGFRVADLLVVGRETARLHQTEADGAHQRPLAPRQDPTAAARGLSRDAGRRHRFQHDEARDDAAPKTDNQAPASAHDTETLNGCSSKEVPSPLLRQVQDHAPHVCWRSGSQGCDGRDASSSTCRSTSPAPRGRLRLDVGEEAAGDCSQGRQGFGARSRLPLIGALKRSRDPPHSFTETLGPLPLVRRTRRSKASFERLSPQSRHRPTMRHRS